MPGTMFLRRITRARDERPARYEAIYQGESGGPAGRQFAREFSSPEELRFFLAEKLHINPDAVKLAVTEMVEDGASELKELVIPENSLAAEQMVSLDSQY